jgi:hypothetical protein
MYLLRREVLSDGLHEVLLGGIVGYVRQLHRKNHEGKVRKLRSIYILEGAGFMGSRITNLDESVTYLEEPLVFFQAFRVEFLEVDADTDAVSVP